ncbi:MAG: Slp family lipoprotein [Nitrospiria bacterium]
MRSYLFVLIIMTLLASCGPKIIPDEIEAKIDKDLPFEEISRDPELHIGRTILVGGEIIETRNLKDGTEIEILQKPLSSDRAPLPVDESTGRFFLVAATFLDPEIFSSGRRVTVVGMVAGGRTQQIGGTERLYPVLEKEHIHLWPLGLVRPYDSSPRFHIGLGAIFSR